MYSDQLDGRAGSNVNTVVLINGLLHSLKRGSESRKYGGLFVAYLLD